MFTKLRVRLRALIHRGEIGDEIEMHLEQLAAEMMEQGMSPREARLAAARQFGNVTQIRERSRDLFSFRMLEDLARDAHYAARVLRRKPLFFGGAALVLALGIGANCAVFNLTYSVLLKPLPYGRPDEIAMLWDGKATTSAMVQVWRERSAGLFADLAVTKMWDYNLEPRFDLVLPDRAERLRGGLVTSNFFTVLGTAAALGRVFTPNDEAAGRDDLVVLSHGLWQRAFGGDPGVVGRRVAMIGGSGKRRMARPYLVLGVMPAGFRFTYPLETEIWAVNSWKTVEAAHPSAVEFNGAVARLAPGVTLAAARAMMERPEPEGTERGRSGHATAVQPISEWVSGQARPSVLLLSAVSLLLLVIACATVSNALLVRLAERKRELAVRASLGAGRARLVRQLLTEGLALSLAGTSGGLLLGAALVPVFRALVPVDFHRADEMAIRPALLLVPAAVATLVTLLALIVPVYSGSRMDLAQVLKTFPGSPAAARCRFVFVAMQATVAAWLLVGAALLIGSFWRLHHVKLGFDSRQVWTAEIRLIDPAYFDERNLARFQQEVLERVRALPGVTEAGMTSAVPFRGVDWTVVYERAGQRKRYNANLREVSPEYFGVMRLALLRGRLLTARDTAASEPAMVISESLARDVFPGEEPVGKQIDLDKLWTVVGVVNDVRYRGLTQRPYPALYVPSAQRRSELFCLILRAPGDRKDIAGMLRGVVRAIDPAVPLLDITTVDRIVADSVADRRFYTAVVSAFAALAVLLTGAGLVVVIARSVAERRRELAIRSALGAQRGQLMELVMRQGMAPVILGTALGLLSASFGVRILERFVFEVKLRDPFVYAGAGAFIILVAVAACLLPARRVSDLAPAVVLQSE